MNSTAAPSSLGNFIHRALFGAALLVSSLFLGGHAQAQNYTYSTGGAAGTSWSTGPGTNWNGGTEPPPDTIIGTISYTSPKGSVDDLMTPGTYTLTNFSFTNPAGGATITSGTAGVNGFTLLNGTITQTNNTANTIADVIVFSGADTIKEGAGSGTLVLSGNISSSSGATLAVVQGSTSGNDSDVLTISGTGNAFTGSITVASGTIDGGNNAAGVDLNSNLNGATYSGTIDITGANAILNVGGGNQTFNATNAVFGTGKFTVSGGTLQIGDGANGTIASGLASVTVSGGTLAFDEATGNTISNAIADSGGTVAGKEGSGITNTLSGAITGTGGKFVQSGAGETILTHANTYTGSNTISAGTVQITNASGLGAAANALAISSGGTLDIDGTSPSLGLLTGAGTLTDSAAGSVTLTIGNGTGTGTFSGAIQTGSGTITLTKAGASTEILSGTNNYTGITTITAGTLEFTTTSALYNNTPASWTTTNLVVGTGGTIAFGVGGSGDFSSDVSTLLTTFNGSTGSTGLENGSSIGFDTTGGNFSISNAITNVNSGANVIGLTKLGVNTLTLTGANTFSGPISIAAGTLQVGNGGTGDLGDVSSGAGTAGNYTNTIALGTGLLAMDSSATQTLGGIISGTASAGLTQEGTGMTVLTAANTYSGATNTVSAGTLQLSGSGTLGATNNALVDNGTVDLDGTNQGVGQLTGTGIVTDSSGTASTLTIDVGTPGNFTWGGVIQNGTGTVSLSKNTTNTATLTGVNTYNGLTTINNGTLQIGNGTSGSANNTSTFTLKGGSLAFDEANGSTINPTINAGASPSTFGTVAGVEGTGITNTLSGVIGGTGDDTAFSQTGVGTTILTAANTFTGAISLANGGNLIIGGSGDLGDNGSGAGNYANTISLGNNAADNFVMDTSATQTLAGVISGTGTTATNFTQAGSGTTVLTAANTYTAINTVSGGTLQLSGAGTLGATRNQLVVNGGAVDLDGTNQGVGAFNGTGGVITDSLGSTISTLTVGNNNGAGTFGGVIQDGSGQLVVTKTGTGTETFTGANTYTGLTTVNGSSGSLVIGNGTTGSLANANTAGYSVTAGTLAFDEVNGSTITQNIATSAGTLVKGLETSGTPGNTNTISGVISGGGGFTQTAAGTGTTNTTILTGANTFTGNIASTSGGIIQIGNGGTGDLGDTSGNGTAGSYAGTIGLSANNNAAFIMDTTATQTLSGNINGSSGHFTQSGTGTTVLTFANTYSGATNTINAGTLQVSGAGTLGANNKLVANGGQLDLDGTSQSVDSLTGAAGVITDSATTTTSTLSVGNANDGGTFGGVIQDGSGQLAVTKTGSGKEIFTGANTYTGATQDSVGTLQIGDGTTGSAAGTASYTLSSSGILAFNEANGSTITQNITDGATTATSVQGAENSGNTNTLSGAISGFGGYAQTGSGTTILSGINTYSGGTTVTAGALLANNTTGSAMGSGSVSVAAGATLGGSGNITPTGTGAGTVDVSGTLAPGNGTDATSMLSINSTGGGLTASTATNVVTLETSAQLTFNLNAGNASNQLNVNGGVSYFGGASSLGTGNTVNLIDLDSIPGDLSTGLYTLVTETSGTGLTFGAMQTDGNYLITGGLILGSGTIDGYAADLEANSNTNPGTIYLDLTTAAVPEPSTWAMLLLGAVGLIFVARRKAKALALATQNSCE